MYIINKDKLRCPTCGAPMRRAIAIDGGYSRYWMRCSRAPACKTYIDTYIPLPHQKAIHKDTARYILNAGGYGSGKTESSIKDRQKKGLITPGGQTLFGAPTMPQLNATLKKDFESDMPIDFVKRYSAKDNKFFLINQHEYLYRSFDDPHKLRSLNLSDFVVVEGSGTKYATFTQLQNRLRNSAATIIERDEKGNPIFEQDEEGNWHPRVKFDWRAGTVETNPDPGWVKTHLLLQSGNVHFYKPSESFEEYRYENINPNISSYIVPTKANFMLPPNYVEEQTINKPNWWIKRYFKGSFAYAEGLVYPEFSTAIVDAFPIPKNWKHIIAMDYGISDNTHFIFGAIDPNARICYLYDELIMNSASIRAIANEYRKKLRAIPEGGLLKTPVMDQRSMDKRQSFDGQTKLGELFLEEGIIFDPAQMNVDARILRVNTFIESGQLKIFATLKGLIKEGLDYKFPEKDLDKPGKNTDKPMDIRNHGVNAMEFLVMELPHNLATADFTVYNRVGRAITEPTRAPRKPRYTGYDPLGDNTAQQTRGFALGGEMDGIDSFYNNHGTDMYHSTAEFEDDIGEDDLDLD
jgi:ssDNA-binding Zn-finger/Zn-ribbon topoisomerase 1